jgi:hypothetical protein
MKTKSLKPWLPAFAAFVLLNTGCQINKFGMLYGELINEHRKELGPQPGIKQIPNKKSCLNIFEMRYPECPKLKTEERVLENRLVFDNACDGPVSGYHRFSLIEFSDRPALPGRDTLFFISFNQDTLGARKEKTLELTKLDSVYVRGAITFYTGYYKYTNRDSIIQLDTRYYLSAKKGWTFFGKDSDYKFSRKERVDLEVYYDRYATDSTIRIYKIIEHGENAVGGRKSLVFDLVDALGVETIPLKLVKRKCDWEK